MQRFLFYTSTPSINRVCRVGQNGERGLCRLIGGKGEVAYSTAKAGIIGLTKSVVKEAGSYGVAVNAVFPGLTRTFTIEKFMTARYKDMIIADTPEGRMAEAEEVARVVAFLASEDASFVTGVLHTVSGGWGI